MTDYDRLSDRLLALGKTPDAIAPPPAAPRCGKVGIELETAMRKLLRRRIRMTAREIGRACNATAYSVREAAKRMPDIIGEPQSRGPMLYRLDRRWRRGKSPGLASE